MHSHSYMFLATTCYHLAALGYQRQHAGRGVRLGQQIVGRGQLNNGVWNLGAERHLLAPQPLERVTGWGRGREADTRTAAGCGSLDE